MQAFFDADVIDVELLYDNAMIAVCYQQARKYGLKYILSGDNEVTEGMTIPKDWNWYKRDVANIKALARRSGIVRSRTFPTHSTLSWIIDQFFFGIRWVPFLDYLPYNKFSALQSLEGKYGYKPYPYKHYESIFTRFYQGYILPQKFGVDKRLLHLSTLVVSGQISRDDALSDLENIPYPSQQALDSDIEYFLKKMGWNYGLLQAYLARPGIPHDYYSSEAELYSRIISAVPSWFKKLARSFVSS